MIRKAFVETAHALVALLLCFGCTGAGAETMLRIGGTGSAVGTAGALADDYASMHPHVQPRIVGNLGTGGALKALRAEALDVAIAARCLDEGERRSGLTEFPLSRTPLVFAAYGRVPLRGISLEQAIRLYGGEQTTWPDGRRVRPILRPMNDTDTATLRAISPAFDVAVLRGHAIKGLYTAITDEDSISAIALTPGAFGTTTLAMLASSPLNVNMLLLDGVAPSQKALSDGLYRLHKTFYIIVRAPVAPEIRQFLGFVSSERGRDILMRHGQIPAAAATNPGLQ